MKLLRTLLLLGVLALSVPAWAEVTVIRTDPQTGSQAVDPNLTQLRIYFSEPVRTTGYSVVRSSLGRFPEITTQPSFEDGGKACVLSVKLAPGTVYSLGINSATHRNFRSAADPDESVTPYVLAFTTSGEGPATKSATQRWQEDLAFLLRPFQPDTRISFSTCRRRNSASAWRTSIGVSRTSRKIRLPSR